MHFARHSITMVEDKSFFVYELCFFHTGGNMPVSLLNILFLLYNIRPKYYANIYASWYTSSKQSHSFLKHTHTLIKNHKSDIIRSTDTMLWNKQKSKQDNNKNQTNLTFFWRWYKLITDLCSWDLKNFSRFLRVRVFSVGRDVFSPRLFKGMGEVYLSKGGEKWKSEREIER